MRVDSWPPDCATCGTSIRSSWACRGAVCRSRRGRPGARRPARRDRRAQAGVPSPRARHGRDRRRRRSGAQRGRRAPGGRHRFGHRRVEARERSRWSDARTVPRWSADDPARRADGGPGRRRHRDRRHRSRRARGGAGHGARRVVLAVPVAARESVQELAGVADEVVVLATPSPFYAVGEWYAQFSQTPTTRWSGCSCPPRRGDDPAGRPETSRTTRSRSTPVACGGRPPHAPRARDSVWSCSPMGAAQPPQPPQPVRGRGAQRRRPRHVAVRPAHAGEAVDRANVFDIELLARRLRTVTRWVRPSRSSPLGVGYFGASTGAAAALCAAADDRRPGRRVPWRSTDLAAPPPRRSPPPTLLIVGVTTRSARAQPPGRRRDVVPAASRSCPAPRTCSRSPARSRPPPQLARDWFVPPAPARNVSGGSRSRNGQRFKETLSPGEGAHVEGDYLARVRGLCPGRGGPGGRGDSPSRRWSWCRWARRTRDLRPARARARPRRPGRACPRHGSLPRSP